MASYMDYELVKYEEIEETVSMDAPEEWRNLAERLYREREAYRLIAEEDALNLHAAAARQGGYEPFSNERIIKMVGDYAKYIYTYPEDKEKV